MTTKLKLVLLFCVIAFAGSSCITGEDGRDGATGSPGLVWRGVWANGVDYHVDDAVEFEGSAFVCLQPNDATPPGNTAYWDLLAAKGEDGDSWEGGAVPNLATFNGGASFPAGAVDFTGATVSGLPSADWQGGPVPNLATFTGGADFPAGAVDFTGATVTGLPSATWQGGTVPNLATFNGGASFPTGSVDFTGAIVNGLPTAEWLGGSVPNLATFNGGASFPTGVVDFSGATVNGLPSSDWQEGGTVSGAITIDIPIVDAVSTLDGSSISIASRGTSSSAFVYADDAGGQVVLRSASWTDGAAASLRADDADGGGGHLRLKGSAGEVTFDTNGDQSTVAIPISFSSPVNFASADYAGSVSVSGNSGTLRLDDAEIAITDGDTGSGTYLGGTGGDAQLNMGSSTYNAAVVLGAFDTNGGGGYLRLRGAGGDFEWDSNTGALRVKDRQGRTVFEVDGESGDIYYTGELKRR